MTITQTRKAGLPLVKPQLLHVGAEARSVIRTWAEEEGVSVNAIMVSVLEQFFKRLRKSKSSVRSCVWNSGQGVAFYPAENQPRKRDSAILPDRLRR